MHEIDAQLHSAYRFKCENGSGFKFVRWVNTHRRIARPKTKIERQLDAPKCYHRTPIVIWMIHWVFGRRQQYLHQKLNSFSKQILFFSTLPATRGEFVRNFSILFYFFFLVVFAFNNSNAAKWSVADAWSCERWTLISLCVVYVCEAQQKFQRAESLFMLAKWNYAIGFSEN